jgi:hypothetical protein
LIERGELREEMVGPDRKQAAPRALNPGSVARPTFRQRERYKRIPHACTAFATRLPSESKRVVCHHHGRPPFCLLPIPSAQTVAHRYLLGKRRALPSTVLRRDVSSFTGWHVRPGANSTRLGFPNSDRDD